MKRVWCELKYNYHLRVRFLEKIHPKPVFVLEQKRHGFLFSQRRATENCLHQRREKLAEMFFTRCLLSFN